MSGFLPDLASWALGGGAASGSSADNSNNNNNANTNNGGSDASPLTEEEIRARRLARMEAMGSSSMSSSGLQPMDVDDAPSNITTPQAAATTAAAAAVEEEATTPRKSSPKQSATPSSESPQNKKKKDDPTRKIQRKKEFLLKKVLQVGNEFSMELEDPIGVHTIAEVFATRLSLSPTESRTTTTPPKPWLTYLAMAHRKATEELQTIKPTDSELVLLLEEMQRQAISYAASSLMEPDLFEQAKDGIEQLTKALLVIDPSQDITTGGSSSFYHLLCDELATQDATALRRVIHQVAERLIKALQDCETLDSGVGETSALGIVAALTSLASHKKAAVAITQLPQFLLPAEGSAQALEIIRPAMVGTDLLRLLAAESRPYQRRSGPGLEKETLLGLIYRISTPKSNPAFAPTNILRQSLDSVERATNQQRQQLRIYQEASHQLLMNLIKAGPDARNKVLEWFVDCILVNPGAAAMRPDPSKVSSQSLLLNVSVALLKLCDPFVADDKKHHLIDTNFVLSSDTGKRIYPLTGDHAISRLGEAPSTVSADAASPYAPKNAFIPQVFFLTARSLALGIVPMLASHENLLRHISHQHWELNSQNRDVYSDPHFCLLVSRQRSMEVSLFQEEMITDTIRFLNLLSKVLVSVPDDMLCRMPEHFVDSVCDVLMGVAKLKARLLRGMDVRHVFQLMVKLLSPNYTSMVRNYNLRAMLGDVLYEIFLPASSDDRRDVPVSLACDPLAGGQSYLLADASAQRFLAPSLLLLYGEVEHTGYYDKMSHRAKISSLLKYLWESSEHRPAFREITGNKESFIKFANGIINETNTLIATVMQKLPEIRNTQVQMANPEQWSRLSEEEQGIITSRLDDNEREVKHALPLCNKTLQMFGYLNTDPDIRSLFLLGELCPRLVNMLLHVLGKLVGSKGLDLKVRRQRELQTKSPSLNLDRMDISKCSFPLAWMNRSTIRNNMNSVLRKCSVICVPSLLSLPFRMIFNLNVRKVAVIQKCSVRR